MNYQHLLDEYGGCTAAAIALGYRKQTVHKWKDGGIPEFEQLVIQKKNSRLKADRRVVRKYRELLAA